MVFLMMPGAWGNTTSGKVTIAKVPVPLYYAKLGHAAYVWHHSTGDKAFLRAGPMPSMPHKLLASFPVWDVARILTMAGIKL